MVQVGVESEDGWRPAKASPEQCEWVTVPGTKPVVSLQLLRGQPAIILRAWAADWNAYIEPLRDADSAGWTPTNVVATSNHLNGTACDLNWANHPFQNRGSLNPAQMQTLSEMEEFYEGTVFWAGRWDDPVDEMHSQMGYGSWNNPHTDDFIHRKIRADGFSTFRRGGIGHVPQPTGRDAIALLIINEAAERQFNRDETIACISTGIQESNLDQNATDSTGHRGVYQQDGGYPNRETAEGNVNGFFERLDAKRHSPGAAADIWLNIFWLQQRPSEPNAAVAFTNGRHGYLTEIKQHIPEATALYDRLSTIQGDEFMPALNNDEQRLLFDRVNQTWGALFNPVRSKSKFADFGEPGEPTDWATKDYIHNDDGFEHESWVIRRALNGDPKAIGYVQRCAASGDIECQTIMARLQSVPVTPVNQTANDITCSNCGKHYPHELIACPFCRHTQVPIVASETPAATSPPAAQANPPASPTHMGDITLPAIDETIVEQFLLLQRFSSELPEDVAKAIDTLIPIIRGLAKGD